VPRYPAAALSGTRSAFRASRHASHATLLHRGDYDTLPAARDALAAWTVASGDVPAGRMRTLYLQFGAEPELRLPHGWVVERAAEFVTELQLPVA
jgi:hypothetical protein